MRVLDTVTAAQPYRAPEPAPKAGRGRVDHNRVRELADLNWTDKEIAAEVGCIPRYAGLIRKGQIKRRSEGGSIQSRVEPKSLAGAGAKLPPYDHPSLMSARTIYPATVIPPIGNVVLKSGYNSAKIGRFITKGRWKGFEVYTLSLEERATCPKSCQHWRSCFGNQMQLAQRFVHGSELEAQIEREVIGLCRKHPRGFSIRLHVLGDFYSVGYVELWARLLDRHPQLHAFGFSARWQYQTDPIAKALIDLVERRWSRFAIRFSNAPLDALATRSVEHPYQIEKGVIWCPQQQGKTASCGSCALCWQSTRNIAFVQH